MAKTDLYRVFVYGTLKRGEPNHSLIQKVENGHAQFLGTGKTIEKYPLVIATKYNIPFLLKKPGTGNQVKGEVYEVDTKMLLNLDKLEDHPRFYVREEEDILLDARNETKAEQSTEQVSVTTKAWVYFILCFKPSLLNGPMYTTYSNKGNHGLKYCESNEVWAKPEDVL